MSVGQEGLGDISDIFVCSRLKKERERLRLGQADVASALKVSTKTVGRWEKEIPIPSDKLFTLQALGFDVIYVLTGDPPDLLRAVNSVNAYATSLLGAERFEVAEPNEKYGDRYMELVSNFKALDELGKLAVEATIKALLTNQKKVMEI